jgi:hypothetical protein
VVLLLAPASSYSIDCRAHRGGTQSCFPPAYYSGPARVQLASHAPQAFKGPVPYSPFHVHPSNPSRSSTQQRREPANSRRRTRSYQPRGVHGGPIEIESLRRRQALARLAGLALCYAGRSRSAAAVVQPSGSRMHESYHRNYN